MEQKTWVRLEDKEEQENETQLTLIESRSELRENFKSRKKRGKIMLFSI